MEQVLLQNSKNIKALIDLMKAHEENIKRVKEDVAQDNDVPMNSPLYNEYIYSNLCAPSEKVCPMSRTYFTPTDKVIMVRECGHIFKKDPFMEWTKNQFVCPRCSCKLF